MGAVTDGALAWRAQEWELRKYLRKTSRCFLSSKAHWSSDGRGWKFKGCSAIRASSRLLAVSAFKLSTMGTRGVIWCACSTKLLARDKCHLKRCLRLVDWHTIECVGKSSSDQTVRYKKILLTGWMCHTLFSLIKKRPLHSCKWKFFNNSLSKNVNSF